jgi:hypothetical protein
MRKKKIVPAKKKRYYLTVHYNYSSEGGEALTNEEWSDRSPEYITTEFLGAYYFYTDSFKNKITCKDFEISFNPENVDSVYLVIVKYSDGDTFGTTFGLWDVPLITVSEKSAEICVKQIRKQTGRFKKDAYQPWQGYFSRLEDVSVVKFDLIKHI